MNNDLFESETVQSQPSYNPTIEGNIIGTMDYVLRDYAMSHENCVPAIIKEYDREKNIAIVKPAISMTTALDQSVERAEIKVPVFSMSGGGFLISLPLKEGDTGWLIVADSDISLFKQNRDVVNANTNRKHAIEDSFFVPDRISDFKIGDDDKDNLIIQTLEGKTKISFLEKGIKIVAEEPLNIECKTADIKASESVSIISMKVTIKGDVIIDGKLSVKEDVNIDKNITAKDADFKEVKANEVNAGNISLKSHAHTGVTVGGEITGDPI